MTRATRSVRAAARRLYDRLRRGSRHDLVLAVIPVAFLLAALVATSPSVPASAAIAAASVVGGVAMLVALFLHPPRRETTGRRRG